MTPYRWLIQKQFLARVLERAIIVQECEGAQVVSPRPIPLPFEQAAHYFRTECEAFSTVLDIFRIASDLFCGGPKRVSETKVGRRFRSKT